MTEITDAIMKYREAARHLWNAALREGADFDVVEDFDEMCSVLFRAMVLRAIGRPHAVLAPSSDAQPSPLRFLRVIPSIEHGTPIMINRESRPSGYWDHPVKSVKQDEVDLRFVRFFDWSQLGHLDFEYVEVTIEAFPTHADLAGRAALLEVKHARIWFDG